MAWTSVTRSPLLVWHDESTGYHQFKVPAVNQELQKRGETCKKCWTIYAAKWTFIYEIHSFYCGFSLKLMCEKLLVLYDCFFPLRYIDTLDGIFSDLGISGFLSVVKIIILSQVKTVFSLGYYSLAFPDLMNGSLICGYIL